MRVLVVAEHDNHNLKAETLATVTAALQVASAVDVVVLGADCATVVDAAAKIDSISEVLLVDNPVYQHPLAENCAPLLVTLAGSYSHLLASSSTFGKNLMPRVAALLDVSQLSDIVEIISENTFVRPIYAGNALATLKALDPIKVITVRASAFALAVLTNAAAPVRKIECVIDNSQSVFIRHELTQSSHPQLGTARIIISGGRGLQSAENFTLLEKIASRLNAAVGASRAAVDAGFAPNDSQIGQTGKIVAPDLYIAVGISGAIQHVAGMKDSKVIVAINNDADAPIFDIADYGLVADLFTVLPELERALAE